MSQNTMAQRRINSVTAKIVVITGATRGLGRALTEGVIAEGHTVWGCGRNVGQIDALSARFPTPNRFDVVDVSDADAVTRWANARLAAGLPEIIVNNAAVMNTPAPTWEVPLDAFSRLIDINLKGVVHVLHAFLPPMVAANRGVVVNLSSGWGRSTAPDVAPYCLSKWGIEGLTQALAQELPNGMCAVALNPGVIDTEMLRQCWGESAGMCASPQQWQTRAVPLILSLTHEHTGRALTGDSTMNYSPSPAARQALLSATSWAAAR